MEADQTDTLITRAGSDDEVELWVTDDNARKYPLFMGQLYAVDVQHLNREVMVTLDVISHSFKLDTQLKNRSFQQVDQRYVEIVDAVLADYKGSDKLDEAFEKKNTGQFIMQYQETDWTFLQRLASHVGAVLVPNVTSQRVQIWIGIPQARKYIQLEGVPFAMQRSIPPYLDQEANGWNTASIGDYTRYTFEWDQMLQLGDEVERNQETFIITKREGQMIRGLMTWSYECAIPQGIKVPKIYNRILIGAAIEGKILEVSRNQVRLHLDMDNRQNAAEARWFPYSAEGSQVWYMMPERGAQVKLYFPSADEDDAIVIQSVRTKPSASTALLSSPGQNGSVESPAERHSRKMADPGIKSFANPQGKEVSLGNSELHMTAQEGALYISMNNHLGVNLNSTQRIWIQASSQLTLDAANIMIQGTNSLQLHTTTTTLDLAQEVNNVSSEIELKGSMHEYYPEPILSAFEQQVSTLGIEAVTKQHQLLIADKKAEGYLDILQDAAKGLWDTVVDFGDMAFSGNQDEEARKLYSMLNGGTEVAPLEERNSTFAGLLNTVDYTEDLITGEKSVSAEFEKAKDSFIEGSAEFLRNQQKANAYHNPLTLTPEESYEIGQIQGGQDLFEMDIASSFFVPSLAAIRNSKKVLSVTRKMGLPDPKLPRPGAHVRSPLFRGLGNIKDAVAKLGDGKLKTHALRLPKNLDSLKGFMQSVARKMNISVKRLSPDPATAAGRWQFHDLEPYSSRSKGPDTPLTPERQRQKDALESGEYSGRAGGTGKDTIDVNKKFPTRSIDMDTEGYIIDRVAELKQRLSNGALNKGGANFGYMEVKVDVPNIKTEFYAHSQVNGPPPAHQPNMNYDGFSYKPETIRYPAKDAPNKQGDIFPREGDTEYKMINDLANKLGPPNPDIKGRIKLFTENDTCASCNDIIYNFTKDYPGIKVEVIHNNDVKISKKS
ncbi:deaminase domain-containing protein [Paenibacillus sp. FSL L8-0436]|uniref:deaminase domain-containing protein n=1 Tax=Paenibacillus sp. FSL L8-0436 TaxID=2954686 RepID=UPI003158D58F